MRDLRPTGSAAVVMGVDAAAPDLSAAERLARDVVESLGLAPESVCACAHEIGGGRYAVSVELPAGAGAARRRPEERVGGDGVGAALEGRAYGPLELVRGAERAVAARVAGGGVVLLARGAVGV